MAFGCSSDSDGNPVEQTYIETESDLLGTWDLVKTTEGDQNIDLSNECSRSKGKFVFSSEITEFKGNQVNDNCVESETTYEALAIRDIGEVTLVDGNIVYWYHAKLDGEVLKLARYYMKVGNAEPDIIGSQNLVWHHYVKLD